MVRHFLGLYVLIVLTLAAVSWGQDRLLQAYGNHDASDDRSVAVAAFSLQNQLRQVPVDQWKRVIADTAAEVGRRHGALRQTDIAGKKDSWMI